MTCGFKHNTVNKTTVSPIVKIRKTVVYFYSVLIGSLFIVEKHCNACADDQDIAEDAEPIGNVSENEKSQHGSKDDLRVIVYGNLPRRGAYIRFRYAELADTGKRSGKYEINQL